jgi:hypothetical protein
MSDESANLPDVSDLKTYDVPDPRPPAGSTKAAFVVALVAAAAAIGFLRATPTAHYFSVLNSDTEYDRFKVRAREALLELPPEELLDGVLAIQDPEQQGAFHAVLATTGDGKHVEAIRAFVRAANNDYYSSHDSEYHVEHGSVSMGKLPGGPPVVLKMYNNSAGEWQAACGRAIETLGPDVMLEPILALVAPFQRGRWHAMLVTTGDPKHIDDIFAHVEHQQKLDGIGERLGRAAGTGRRFDAEAKSIIAFGEAGTPRLRAALQTTDRAAINLAAEALREVNLPFLITHCRAKLGEYAKEARREKGLYWAFQVARLYRDARENPAGAKPGTPTITAAQNAEATKVLKEFDDRSFRIVEMLKALSAVPDNEDADFCFIHGLSSFSKAVAEYCATTLQTRLTTDELVDVLFRYIAKKSEFEVREVEVYEQLLRATGTAGGARIGVNLTRLMKDAEGDPEKVFWIYKRMAFTVLAETGGPGAIPAIEPYLKDTQAFILTGSAGGRPTRREVKYADIARKAIAAIRKRGGK